MNLTDKIYISGHSGMVGSALIRLLASKGFKNLITKTHNELDLINQRSVEEFFLQEKPDIVFLIAAKVGGIQANIDNPAVFLYNNLMIESNIIHSSYVSNAKKVVFIGSSCIYPKDCPQPMREEYLLTGPLESTNESYAISKIAGLKLIQSYNKQYGLNGLNVMPSNLYGKGDSFDPKHSHVLSALVKKIVDAKENKLEEITNWGTGVATREFLNVDDFVESLLFLMDNWNSTDIINVGTGKEISILHLSELIAELVGFKGKILWDNSKPDGMLKKCMDISKLKSLGYNTKISLRQGIQELIKEYYNIRGNL